MGMSKLVDENMLQVYRMVVGPFDNNSYLITDTQQSRCVVIDAAADADRILKAINSHQLVAILQTHTHMDHTQALREVRERTGAPVGIHPLEPEAAELGPEISLADGQRIAVGSHELQVLHTPGHTPGSLCFLLRPALCFCGDTIFPGGPGKTWSPEAFHQLTQSLEQKIYTLVDRVRLLPGHGEEIAVGESRREYEAFKSRPLKETPWGDVLWEEP